MRLLLLLPPILYLMFKKIIHENGEGWGSRVGKSFQEEVWELLMDDCDTAIIP